VPDVGGGRFRGASGHHLDDGPWVNAAHPAIMRLRRRPGDHDITGRSLT